MNTTISNLRIALRDAVAQKIGLDDNRSEFMDRAERDLSCAPDGAQYDEAEFLAWAIEFVKNGRVTPCGPTEVWGSLTQRWD